MLFSEASSPDLEQRKGIIERLATDLEKNGIKFRQSGSTALDIFNSVTVAQPIYTAVANKNGAFDIIDKSVERAKLSKLPTGAVALYGDYNDRGRLVSLNTTAGTGTGYYEGDYGIGMRHVYNSGGITVMSSEDVRVSANGEPLFGHLEWVKEEDDEVLKSIDTISNGTVVNHKAPGVRARKADPSLWTAWRELVQAYYRGTKPAGEQLYDIALRYIVETIGTSTVNAAIKGGKDKYMIKPAQELLEILEDVFSSKVIDNNFDEVSNTNAEHPMIQFTPCDYITIKVTVSRPTLTARGVLFNVFNTDKTILYNDIRKNNEAINTPGYEIKIGAITVMSEKIEGKRGLDSAKIGDVARLIVNYIKANKALAVEAAAIKAKTTAFNQKASAKAAAEKERIAKEVEKTHARLDRRDAAKQLKNSNKIDDVASGLWGSDEEYDKFLDSLL